MPDAVIAIGQVFLVTFAALFPIINPPGTALLFHAMTRRHSMEDRAYLAGRIALYSAIIIVASLSVGSYVLSIFGISVPVLRVAGGIVVCLIGWSMLASQDPGDDEAAPAKAISPSKGTDAFYPLTMPLTTGPGTIAICVALGTSRPEEGAGFGVIGALAGVAAIIALIYVCYRFSYRIDKVLGTAGSQAFGKLFSFILICIGVQTFWAGFSELWSSLPR